MRAGGCTLQQALTAEAATVIKQAVTLAKRRGHVQVTPLHVANTMLSSSQGLLRTACLQSHSHPLQCKALELCFNVALNRLPASSSANSSVVPMMGSQCSQQQHHPSISNALVAAFKRAQAHQRRGSVENQQQPLLAVKIELDQLIISILDDPSVSRVMREAGFSSTQVKSNVEKAGSLERTPTNSSSKSSYKTSDQTMGVHHKPREASDYCTRNEDDVSKVIETLMEKKRRNPIIVGECVATLEDVIRQVMDKVEKGDAPEAVKDVKFISLSLQSLMGKTKVEVDYEIQELRSCFVKNDNMGRLSKGGVILYMGDLKWTADFRVDCFSDKEATRLGLYCPVEHMIMELGKLLVCDDDDGRFWVMGVASFQTYIKCRDGHPSLESIWSLLPLTIAADTLSLSLNSDREARSAQSGSNCDNNQSSSTTLPTWLRQYKDENKIPDINHQECVHVESLWKWNSISYSVQEQYTSSCGKTMPPISSVSPSSSTSGFSSEYQNPNFFHQNWPSLLQHESTTHSNTTSSEGVNKAFETSLAMQQHTQSPFSSNPNSTTSSSDVVMETEITEYVSKFKSITAENFELLRGALEKKVPSQMDIIPDIAGTILRCRSGMMKRNGEFNLNNSIEFPKEEAWLLFQGSNVQAKVKIGRELAWLVFGSRSNFISVALSSFSTDEYLVRNKTTPADKSCSSYIDRFSKEVSSNPHRVFFIDDIEQADYWTQIGLKQSIERGKVTDSEGQEVSLCDSIIILSCESMSSRSRACSPPVRKKSHGADDEADKDDTPDQVTSPCVSLDLDLNLSVEDNASSNDMGILILESVDRRFIFKIQESS